MAPVEFTVTGGEGSPLEFVAALTPAKSLLVVTDPGGWAQVSQGLAVGRTASAAVPTRVRVVKFAVLDLRHFPSAAVLPSITDVPGDVVALHDTRSWDTGPVVAALRGLGRPVVLFTAVHSWVSVDPSSVLIGWSAPHVVLAEPRGAGAVRVEDVLWQFRELERRRMVSYTALPEPPEPDPDREVKVVVALPGATEGIAGALRPGADYEVWVRVGAHPARLPGDVELRAVLGMSGREVQAESFVLPADGASPWVSFPVTTPYAAVPWSGELVIYHGVVPVHVQQVVLPVGAGESRARPRHRLTRTFADVGPWASRAASIMVAGDRALVAIGDDLVWTSVKVTCELPLVLELDPWYGKGFPAFCADLAASAVRGAALYAQLFPDGVVIPRGSVITVVGPSRVPWALMYDQPFADGPYRVCVSVQRFGPFGAGGEVPPHCPEPDHSGNVLCPYGFWGLSNVLEQPAGPPVWPVRPRPVEVAMAVDPDLDRALTQRHVAELMSVLPPEAISSAYVSASALGRALSDETADVMHLVYDEGVLESVEIEGWQHGPLVVTTAPAADLVDAFVNQAGASGVICPSVPVEQGMAGWVSGLLIARLAEGMSAGEALRRTRWEMLGRGNVMGLAYTLHAGADLRLR